MMMTLNYSILLVTDAIEQCWTFLDSFSVLAQ